ncbi:MAG TPA: hypothetical protein VIK33_10595 [Anaerolineae bacterium]
MSNHFYDEGEPARGQKVLLATPAYGTTSAAYTFSIARSREALHAAGIQSAYLILQGNCHVDDGRNSIVRDFLESDCTDLVFLDADVDWEPTTLVHLCQRDLDIVGGVYPFRREGGENMPVRLMAGATERDGLLEVEGLPTGFVKIKRHVLEKMAAIRPWYFDKIYPTHLVFDRPDPDAEHTRWGGDIDFCNRWRAMGGKLYADCDMRLGHTATVVLRDSLGASLRRLSGTTLAHVIPKIRACVETETDYSELFRYVGTNYAVDAGVLALLTGVARKCRGPIIETGSGLSSVVMAAATSETVYSLEHIDHYAAQTHAWAEEASIAGNLGICCAPLNDFWYDLDKFALPNKFALGFCDGPPRMYGTRLKFFDLLASRCSVIVADDIKSDNNYARAVHEWAHANGRTVTILGRAALIAPESLWQKAA